MTIFGIIPPRMLKRFIVDALLVCGAFLFPWWLVLSCASVLVFVFEDFLELFLIAFLIDLLYGNFLPYFSDFSFILSIGAVVLYMALSTIKRRMRF